MALSDPFFARLRKDEDGADAGASDSPVHPTMVLARSLAGHLQYRSYEAARAKQRPLLNRDIQRLFEPLRITEIFLLKTNLREVLFRKPADAAVAPSAAAPTGR